MKREFQTLVFTTLLAAASNANSALIEASDSRFSWTTDSSTSLDWLDFDGGPAPGTVNRSYSEVMAELGVGGDYSGWRFASRAEIYQFLLNATGYPFLTPGWSTNNEGATIRVAAWTGYTNQSATLDVLLGFSGDLFSSCCDPDVPYFVGLYNQVAGTDEGKDAYVVNTANPTGGYVDLGSWLVRGDAVPSVPEPTTLALLILGLAAIGYQWSKRAV